MSSIELHFSDEAYNFMDEKTAKVTWEKLEKLYMGKTLSNKLFLKINFLTFVWRKEVMSWNT